MMQMSGEILRRPTPREVVHMPAKEKTFIFKDWLSDGIQGMRTNLEQKKRREPSAVRRHLRSACKEVLLAARSVLDEIIEYLEADPEPKEEATENKS
jgi:hypothetical protein